MPEDYSGPPKFKFITTIPELTKYAKKMGLPVDQPGMATADSFDISFDMTMPEVPAATAPVAPATYNVGVQPAVPYKPVYNAQYAAPYAAYSPYTAYPYAYNHHRLFKREADPEDTYNLFVKVNGETPQGAPKMFKYSGNLAQFQGFFDQLLPGMSAYTHNYRTYKFNKQAAPVQAAPVQTYNAYNPYFMPYNYGFHSLNKREAQPEDTYNLFVQIDGDIPAGVNMQQVQQYLKAFLPALAWTGNQAQNSYVANMAPNQFY